MAQFDNRRILIVDDTTSIHADFQSIFQPRPEDGELADLEAHLFGEPARPVSSFDLAFAQQGSDGVELARDALERSHPFAMAFVDMRMPPGWDGVRTVEELWKLDPLLQVVLCTAYSDEAWEQVLERLDVRDRLLVIKKPFAAIEVSQAAATLTAKRELARSAASQIQQLEEAVRDMRQGMRATANVILDMSRHLLATPLTDRQHDCVAKVQAAGQQVLGVVEDRLAP